MDRRPLVVRACRNMPLTRGQDAQWGQSAARHTRAGSLGRRPTGDKARMSEPPLPRSVRARSRVRPTLASQKISNRRGATCNRQDWSPEVMATRGSSGGNPGPWGIIVGSPSKRFAHGPVAKAISRRAPGSKSSVQMTACRMAVRNWSGLKRCTCLAALGRFPRSRTRCSRYTDCHREPPSAPAPLSGLCYHRRQGAVVRSAGACPAECAKPRIARIPKGGQVVVEEPCVGDTDHGQSA